MGVGAPPYSSELSRRPARRRIRQGVVQSDPNMRHPGSAAWKGRVAESKGTRPKMFEFYRKDAVLTGCTWTQQWYELDAGVDKRARW